MSDVNKLIVDSGLLFQANRVVFNPFGLSLCYKIVDGKTELYVKDMRQKPEEAIFSKDVFDAAAEKYDTWTLKEGFAISRQREKKLGYATQDWNRKVFK